MVAATTTAAPMGVQPKAKKKLSQTVIQGPNAGARAWSIGVLWKTLANRFESVIQIYRRDLKEFGSVLQKETVVFREAASRATKDLPTSIEAGASVAHGSLETVGHAIDGVWKSRAEIISQANRSESVIEIYRRDLKEFGSVLQKETVVFREVASRAMKDLPTSIEVGASVAHGSLETVGHTIDGVWKSTAEIISQGKDALLRPSDALNYSNHSVNSMRYSPFDALLHSIQSD